MKKIIKRQNASLRKPQIVQAFYETIIKEGFEGASLAKVAQRCGLKQTLILHYFKNKENLTLACVDRAIEEYSKLLQRYIPNTDDPEKRLMGLLKALWSREYYEAIHIASSFAVIDISFRNKKVKQRLERLYHIFKRFLIHELSELQKHNVIHTQDIEKTAEVLMAMVEGSRHFSHFFIHENERDKYHQSMVMAALSILKNPSGEL
ncbi:MAG: TetR/AcrR family transcriptional regulator [Spirochaetota bacterium]|nr:TetR/AcrR family transcriptional regulator [Spirochaetota bacterium]